MTGADELNLISGWVMKARPVEYRRARQQFCNQDTPRPPGRGPLDRGSREDD